MKTPLRLSTRILLVAGANLLLLFAGFAVFLTLQLKEGFGYFLLTAGRDKVRVISPQLSRDLEGADRRQWDTILDSYSRSNGVTFTVFGLNGDQIAGPRLAIPAEVQARLHPRAEKPGLWVPPFVSIAKSEVPYWIAIWLQTEQQDVRHGPPSSLILVVSSQDLITNPFFFHITPWIGMAACAAIITLLCWIPMMRGIAQSIERMKQATAQIAEGNFNTPLDIHRTDELGQLGESIQQMATRLDESTKAHKRFLGDVAHELRSPLARMGLAVDILERFVDCDDASLNELKKDITTMSSLTDELLTFARAKLVPQPSLKTVCLLPVAQRAVDVEAGNSQVRLEIEPSLHVHGEPEYLFRSVSNLIRNAIRYSGGQGISVSAQNVGGVVELIVADSGPGIPEDALEKVFTPFYRIEESRVRESGGAGLGLAIVQACVQACHGSVVCRNRVPGGLEVTITLQAA